MDVTQFGMRRRPFRPTPDTQCYCPTDAHEAAATAVQRAFASGGSVALVDGPAGTGKTLLGLRFLESLPAHAHRVMVQVPPAVTPAAFFQSVLFDLGRPYQGLTEPELRLAVYGELLTALDDGRPVVLLADEAQHLSAEVLEEIRLLGNLESKESKAVFVLLLGLLNTGTDVSERASAAFAQRVSVRGRLAPLTREESIRYLRHQVRECGGRPDKLLTDEALHLLADHGGGIPRVLNRAAGLAFDIAAAAGTDGVDAEAVLDALTQLDLIPDTAESPVVLPMPVPTENTKPAGKRNPPRPAQVAPPVLPMQKRPVKGLKRKSA